MFRSQPYLEKTAYVQVNLDTPLTYPGNNQTQNKSGHKFTVRDRDNFYDWYNAYFSVDFKFEAVANGANIGADTESSFWGRARALLSHGGATVQTIIPLNRYSFFEGLSDRLLPPMQREFEIVLQDDREMIFQNDGTARRIVVRRLELWVP